MTTTLRERLKARAGTATPTRGDGGWKGPMWLPEAARRYEAGETTEDLAGAFNTNAGVVCYWLKKAGVQIRDRQQIGREKADRVLIGFPHSNQVTQWINQGRNWTLDAGIARLEAAAAEDLSRMHAYEDGADYWRERWGAE